VPVDPVSSVYDLVMRTHVKKIASRCFAVLRQLRQIRRYVSTDTFQALVIALVVTRLNYGKKERIVLREIYLRTTGRYLSNGITQCYLLPDKSGRPAFTPTGQVGTRFIDPVRMKC